MSLNRFYPAGITACLKLGTLALVTAALFSCTKKKTDASKIPNISFTGISGNLIKAGSPEVIGLQFTFTDGDGDLGNPSSSGNYDIYTIDTRDTTEINYYFPQNIRTAVDPSQGMSGSCTVALEGSFILLRPDHPTRDTVRYEVYIKDRAGNESNRFTTPDIYIVP